MESNSTVPSSEAVGELVSGFTTTIKERPQWLYIDVNGKEKVNVPELAKEIMQEARMVVYPNFPYPLQYDEKGGYWKSFDIDKYTEKKPLKNYNKQANGRTEQSKIPPTTWALTVIKQVIT